MGELEYYIIGKNDDLYPALDQKGYHSALPFTNYEDLRIEAMQLIAQCGGKIKYGHSEVGNFKDGELMYEQQEIEFMPVDPENAVEQLIIAKWILRMLGNKYGVMISFAPKITVGKAGSGMHIHFQIDKNDVNVMVDDDRLSDVARKAIVGILGKSKSLTAFGNTVPLSYLRLVPHQEAPTMICWGDSNRSVLVRVPLGWIAKTNMIKDANPQERGEVPLIAGMILAAKDGILDDGSLKTAEELYVSVNIFDDENVDVFNKLEALPRTCNESAIELDKARKFYNTKKECKIKISHSF